MNELRDAISSKGFSNPADFFVKYPTASYTTLARTLGPSIAPLALVKLRYQLARHEGSLREAARESLIRELNGHLKRGWGVGTNARFHCASAFSFWLNGFKEYAYSGDDESLLLKVWDALTSSKPPTGWHPTSCNDPLITAAFEKGWPLRGD